MMAAPALSLESFGPDYRFTRQEVALITGWSVKHIIRAVERGLLREERCPSLRGTRSAPRYTRAAIKLFLAEGYAKNTRR